MFPKILLVFIVFLTSYSCPIRGEGVDSLLMLIDTQLKSEEQIRIKLQIVDELKDSDIKQAILIAKEALGVAESLKNKELIAEAFLATGKCYNYLGANTEALDNLSKALTLFGEMGDKHNRSQTLIEIGNIYFHARQFNLALGYFEEAFDCGKALDNTQLMIRAIIGKGSIYGNTNRLDSALIIFNETFQLSQAINDEPNEVHSLYNIGDVYRFTKRPEKALEVFKLIERKYDLEKINTRVLTNLYISFTDTYLQLGDSSNAQRYNKKTKAVLQNNPSNTRRMAYYSLSFRIDTLRGNLNSAIKNHIRFKELSDSITSNKFNESLANFQNYMGSIKRRRK